MMNARSVSIGVSISLVICSVSLMLIEQGATTRSWGILLLTPFPIAFALSRNEDITEIEQEELTEWNEDDLDSSAEGIGDPVDAGFDIPVL